MNIMHLFLCLLLFLCGSDFMDLFGTHPLPPIGDDPAIRSNYYYHSHISLVYTSLVPRPICGRRKKTPKNQSKNQNKKIGLGTRLGLHTQAVSLPPIGDDPAIRSN